MMKSSDKERLMSYVDALRPLIYIPCNDFDRIDKILGELDPSAKIYEFSNALGHIDFQNKNSKFACDLNTFLRLFVSAEHPNAYIVLKDVFKAMDNPVTIDLIKSVCRRTLNKDGYQVTIFVISNDFSIPKELESLTTIFDIPIPSKEQILEVILDFCRLNCFEVDDSTQDMLCTQLRGFDQFSIIQILNYAFQQGGSIGSNATKLINEDKKQMILKSGVVELVDSDLGFNSVGGLGKLRKWLTNKSMIYKKIERAEHLKVDIPKGTLIIGIPGCGKSLTAKATACEFGVPLIRLDIGRLLGKYIGESEENLRKALRITEAISPCVLWIDELEKAFSGVGDGKSHEVTTRMFGFFLTWMQEKTSPVFVVATTNNVKLIPPEFLRKGRFDELFFVDFPNDIEVREILSIHINKRLRKHNIDLGTLTHHIMGRKDDKGKLMQFSGADIEAIVKEVVEKAFIKQVVLNNEDVNNPSKFLNVSTNDFISEIDKTKPISVTLGSKIAELKKDLEAIDVEPAT